MATSSRPASSSSSGSSFEDATENLGIWFQRNGRLFAIAAGAAVVAVLGAWGWRASQRSTAVRAEQAFFQAQAPLATGDLKAAEGSLKQVAQRYDGTAGGAQAQMTLAQVYFDQGRWQDGLAVLAQASDAPDYMQDGVRQLTAAGYQGVNRHVDAAKLYEQLAGATKAAARRDELLASAARAYQAANDRASAQRLWAQLAAREGAAIADEARVRLGELQAAPAGR